MSDRTILTGGNIRKQNLHVRSPGISKDKGCVHQQITFMRHLSIIYYGKNWVVDILTELFC